MEIRNQIKKGLALLLAALVVVIAVPPIYAQNNVWKQVDGWQLNSTGSATHSSGSEKLSPVNDIDNNGGFSVTTRLHIDSANPEDFSSVWKLQPNNNLPDHYIYMRVKRANGNWCAELQFYNGEWTTLTPREGASGEWVSGIDDEVTVTLEHPEDSRVFNIKVANGDTTVVGGSVYMQSMDSFISQSKYRLEIYTDNPVTDVFTLSNYSETDLAAQEDEPLLPTYGGWTTNEDGSVTHLSGSKAYTYRNIANTDGFATSLQLHIDSASDEMFSMVYKLSPTDNPNAYIFLRVKRSHENWCVEPQFYDGANWHTLRCAEGRPGLWVSGIQDDAAVTLEHPKDSEVLRLRVGPAYSAIMSGNVYLPVMDAFLAATSYKLDITTECPNTDVFTLRGFTVKDCQFDTEPIFVPDAPLLGKEKTVTITPDTEKTASLVITGAAVAAGDFKLCYGADIIRIEAATVQDNALLMVTGEPGEEILSFLGNSDADEQSLIQLKITFLTNAQSAKVTACCRNIAVAAGQYLTDETAVDLKLPTSVYTVTWSVNGVETTEAYEEGQTPSFKGSTDKPADNEYTYTFTGWLPEIAPVTSNITYTAQYDRTPLVCEHSWELDIQKSVAATCTEEGKNVYTCKKCGQAKEVAIEALGHAWNEGEVTTAPTETEKGVMTYSCSRCDAIKTEELPATKLPFEDVKEGKWYYEAVAYAYANKLFAGTSDTSFSPDGNMTRGMLVSVLWRMDNCPEPVSNNPFTDVPDGQWYTKAVVWAAGNKLVMGDGKGHFNPNGDVTREQIAVIMLSYAKFKSQATSTRADLSAFSDSVKVSSWAKDALSWANAEGLVSGAVIGGKTLLNPKGNASRAQVASILMRYIENIAEAG